jgi:hypothetical protein
MRSGDAKPANDRPNPIKNRQPMNIPTDVAAVWTATPISMTRLGQREFALDEKQLTDQAESQSSSAT